MTNRGQYAENLLNDLQVRAYVEKKLSHASVSKILIERPAQNARVTIYTARPGIVIGKKGEDVDRLRKDVSEMMGVPVQINIEEIRKPDLDAKLVADSVAWWLTRSAARLLVTPWKSFSSAIKRLQSWSRKFLILPLPMPSTMKVLILMI